MNIIYYHPFFNADEWLSGIQKRLPQAKMRVWQPGDTGAADYALMWKPPYEMLAGRSGLKAIFALGAGVDAILAQEKEHPGTLPAGIPVIRLQDAGMALQMEEYSVACGMRYFRRFDEYAKLQSEKKWQYLPPHTHDKFTVGVMGLGVLGGKVAERFASFGFKVKGWSRTKKQISGIDCYGQSELTEFLEDVKLLINLVPNTPETVGVLNKDLFSKLAEGAYLINLARGVHLIEQDLLDALASGQVKAATLDVFTQEPLSTSHPFWSHPKVTLTPHISAITYPDVAMDQICNKIKTLEAGGRVEGLVDMSRGY